MNPAGERFLQSCAQQYLGERDIVELTLSIGWWGRVARALVPLEVEIDEQAVGSTGDLIGRRAVREQVNHIQCLSLTVVGEAGKLRNSKFQRRH